ncbi:MAG: hypothetical protein GY679_02085 [Mycoplasma sp.]|nr:hypothetical protein [Mycoplasma sp.]
MKKKNEEKKNEEKEKINERLFSLFNSFYREMLGMISIVASRLTPQRKGEWEISYCSGYVFTINLNETLFLRCEIKEGGLLIKNNGDLFFVIKEPSDLKRMFFIEGLDGSLTGYFTNELFSKNLLRLLENSFDEIKISNEVKNFFLG